MAKPARRRLARDTRGAVASTRVEHRRFHFGTRSTGLYPEARRKGASSTSRSSCAGPALLPRQRDLRLAARVQHLPLALTPLRPCQFPVSLPGTLPLLLLLLVRLRWSLLLSLLLLNLFLLLGQIGPAFL